jgi:hypothetical protein
MQDRRFHWLIDVAARSVPPFAATYRYRSASVRSRLGPWMTSIVPADFRSMLVRPRRSTLRDLDQGGAAAETIQVPCNL